MNTYGTKQHWIPAAVLGRFRDSQSKAKKRVRENEIIIRRRGQIGLSVNKAGAICFKKGLYDINPQTAKMYDYFHCENVAENCISTHTLTWSVTNPKLGTNMYKFISTHTLTWSVTTTSN